MTTGSYNGIHLAGLLSASALYAGILGYLHFQGTESLDNARHGVAVNEQLQQDLEQRAAPAAAADPSADTAPVPVAAEDRIVRPPGGGLFGTAVDQPPADEKSGEPAVSAGAVQRLPSAPVASDEAPVTRQPAARGETLVAMTAPVYPAYAPQADAYGFGNQAASFWDQAGRADYRGLGRGDGRGAGRGRGNWDGDGEFSFSMRFKSRMRADADVDADSAWNAESDARAWQDAQQRLWWRQYQDGRYYAVNR
jgi:hypothetical protein